jgi:hypothetical protein
MSYRRITIFSFSNAGRIISNAEVAFARALRRCLKIVAGSERNRLVLDVCAGRHAEAGPGQDQRRIAKMQSAPDVKETYARDASESSLRRLTSLQRFSRQRLPSSPSSSGDKSQVHQ